MSNLKRRKHMASRTPEGKHTKRFIVLERNEKGKFVRSALIPAFYETKDTARFDVDNFVKESGLNIEFKIRQK
jgi:hypothetical protein